MTPIALAITCLLAITLGYILVCWVQPFARCRKCEGLGLVHPKHGFRRHPKPCKRCDATGLRLRIGRRIRNRTARAAATGRRIHHDARH